MAKGADIGMPMKEYIMRFLCKACRSELIFLSKSVTDSFGIRVCGNATSTTSFPDNSSFSLLLDNGGTDFNPHSANGIRMSARLP